MDLDLHLIPAVALVSWMFLSMLTVRAEQAPGLEPDEGEPEEGARPHPRLYFGARDLPRLTKLKYAARQFLSEESFTVRYFGGEQVTFPLPPRQPGFIENPAGFDPKSGRYPYWTGMAKQIQARLESLALSYATTSDDRYARRAAEYMLALAAWQTWSDPDYSDRTCLDTCHLTLGVAFAYDVCWQALSAAERDRVREALGRLGLAGLARDGPERVEHNLQMLRNAALGVGGLAIVPEQPEAWTHVQAAREFFRWWLDLRATSPNTEGLSYTSYGLDNCMLFGAALAQAEGDREVLEHSYIARAARWALYFWGPGRSGLVNFCDAAVGHPFEATMRVANKYLRDPYAGYYLQQTGRLQQEGFVATVLHDPKPPVAWPPPWPASACFPNIGWAALRSGWKDHDTLFAFISSSSKEGHCHFDANHFVINCAGDWLATDAGYKSFKGGALTDFSQGTAGHNSVLISGAGQKEKAGVIADFFTSPAFDYVVGDASRAYDPQVLWRFLRRVVYVKPHFFAMLDELEAPEPKRFEFLLHGDAAGRCEVDGREARPGEARTAQRVALIKPGTRLDVRFLEPATAHVAFDHSAGTSEDYPPHITVRDSRPRESQRFLAALVAAQKPASPFTLELESYAEEGDASLVRLGSYGALLFRALGPGDRLTLSLPVPADGTYNLTAHFLRSPAYGDWQVRIDGAEAGATYSGYAPDVRARQAWNLGAMELSRGSHEFTFEVVGKHDLSSGYLVGIDDIRLEPVEQAAPASPQGPTRFRRLQGDGWVGVGCSLAGARCHVYFRLTGADEIQDKDLRTDAEAAMVIAAPKGQPQVAAYRVTRMEIGGRELVEASAPINFALLPGETWSLTVESDSRADIVLHLQEQPRRPSIPASLARGVRYDPTAPALRIRLRPGSHTITWTTK
jgi:hypothetical protein